MNLAILILSVDAVAMVALTAAYIHSKILRVNRPRWKK